MKIHYLISTLFLYFLISGCNKFDTEKNKEAVGKYDWRVSNSVQTNGLTSDPLITTNPAIVGKNYGIQIKKNLKVIFFENGKQIQEGKVKSYERKTTSNSSYLYLIVEMNGGEYTFNHSDGILICHNWPFEKYQNQFMNIKPLQ